MTVPKVIGITWREGYALSKILIKLGGVIASFALMVTAMNMNATCICLIHQPKLPEGAAKLRNF